MARNSAESATARRGLAISGSAGRGKSTAALLIGRRRERVMRAKLNRYDDGFAPVVYSVVPPGTTPKMMMLAFVNFLSKNRRDFDDSAKRSSLVAKEVETITPARDDADPWRATNRVWKNLCFHGCWDTQRSEGAEKQAFLVDREEVETGSGVHDGAPAHSAELLDVSPSSRSLRSTVTVGRSAAAIHGG
jgi:hypothetical protein